MPLPIVPASEFKRLQDVDPIPDMVTMGNHLAHALTYWQQAETQAERDHWAYYLVMCVRGCRPR